MSAPAEGAFALLPKPASVAADGRGAELGDGLVIRHPDDEGFAAAARFLRNRLEEATGWRVTVAAGSSAVVPAAPVVELRAAKVAPTGGAEAVEEDSYELVSTEGGVVVTAPYAAGAFYGVQTLRQLLGEDAFRQAPIGATPTRPLPGLRVKDAPRFSWRGCHLDVCRHFMPKRFLLRLVDLLALHKMNVLHLHLTDDQGWRVEIEKYPRLTEVGAWRRCSPIGHADEGRFDDVPHGGFYTRADLEEVVAYARERHVRVLPEIEMPGHTVAAIAAYPKLGNTAAPLEVWTSFGIAENVFNLEEETVAFCCDVLDEVTSIFPGRYVHVGGDECPTTEWAKSARARNLMEEHGFSDERQLQGWFTRRIADHLAASGRLVVGWDEMLEGGAPADSVVMSWRGEAGGVAAAAAGHDVVMAPEEFLYLDWAQSHSPCEPLAIRASLPLEKVYGYDPLASVPSDHHRRVLGAQCQLWTEYVPTPERAEYQYFPRVSALAEVLWSGPGADAFPSFAERLRVHLGRLAASGVNFRPLGGPNPGQSRCWHGTAPHDS